MSILGHHAFDIFLEEVILISLCVSDPVDITVLFFMFFKMWSLLIIFHSFHLHSSKTCGFTVLFLFLVITVKSLSKNLIGTPPQISQLLFGYETFSASGNSSVNRLIYHWHVKPYPVCRKNITRKTKTKHIPTHSISMVHIYPENSDPELTVGLMVGQNPIPID